MVLKVYGHPYSTYTKIAVAILKEKNVPFEFVTLEIFKGEHRTAAVAEKNPFVKVPYIVGPQFYFRNYRRLRFGWIGR